MNASTNRQEIRNTLLLNGYRPLPLADKGIFIQGWVKAEITEEWLSQWARHARYTNTGIRCDDLIAIDIDVLSGELADAVEAYVESKLGESEFCRVGRHPKRLLLYRVDGEQGRSARTGRFEDADGLVHQVELLSGRGRQFAAFGRHPSGTDYQWLGPSPLDTEFADLPACTHADALKCLDGIEDLFTVTGLKEGRSGYMHGAHGGSEYDLADDTEVMADGQIVKWGDLKATLDKAGVFGNLKREDGEFGDSDGVHFMLARGSREPCAHDFVRDVTHWDSLAAPQVAQLLPSNAGTSVQTFAQPAVAELVENWAIVSDMTVRPLDDPTRPIQLQGFIRNRKHLMVPDPNPPANNPNRQIPATEAWERSPLTVRADYAELRPDCPDDEVITTTSGRVLNTYMPPDHPSHGGELRTVHEFIRHLVPEESERDIFWDWHASKYAHPDRRQHAMVMVTPAYGTGRGTWVQILQQLFGIRYVNEIPLDRIVGQGSQSQYNEFLADSLIVTVGEALIEQEGRSKWSARHVAYERIKTTIEPQATFSHITRKYGRNTVERVFASLFITSNHPDALAIEPDDRRVVALTNTETPLTEKGTLLDRIHAWKESPENIGALGRFLIERAERGISYDPLGKPPMTPAKEAMIEAAQSDTERLFEAFAVEAVGAVCTHSQWRTFAHANRMRLEVELPTDADKLSAALTVVLRKHARKPVSTKIKLRGNTIRPWILRDFERWKVATNVELREELLKNGPPGASVVDFPKPDKG